MLPVPSSQVLKFIYSKINSKSHPCCQWFYSLFPDRHNWLQDLDTFIRIADDKPHSNVSVFSCQMEEVQSRLCLIPVFHPLFPRYKTLFFVVLVLFSYTWNVAGWNKVGVRVFHQVLNMMIHQNKFFLPDGIMPIRVPTCQLNGLSQTFPGFKRPTTGWVLWPFLLPTEKFRRWTLLGYVTRSAVHNLNTSVILCWEEETMLEIGANFKFSGKFFKTWLSSHTQA